MFKKLFLLIFLLISKVSTQNFTTEEIAVVIPDVEEVKFCKYLKSLFNKNCVQNILENTFF